MKPILPSRPNQLLAAAAFAVAMGVCDGDRRRSVRGECIGRPRPRVNEKRSSGLTNCGQVRYSSVPSCRSAVRRAHQQTDRDRTMNQLDMQGPPRDRHRRRGRHRLRDRAAPGRFRRALSACGTATTRRLRPRRKGTRAAYAHRGGRRHARGRRSPRRRRDAPRRCGRIDALVCSAGITGPNTTVASTRWPTGSRCSTST